MKFSTAWFRWRSPHLPWNEVWIDASERWHRFNSLQVWHHNIQQIWKSSSVLEDNFQFATSKWNLVEICQEKQVKKSSWKHQKRMKCWKNSIQFNKEQSTKINFSLPSKFFVAKKQLSLLIFDQISMKNKQHRIEIQHKQLKTCVTARKLLSPPHPRSPSDQTSKHFFSALVLNFSSFSSEKLINEVATVARFYPFAGGGSVQETCVWSRHFGLHFPTTEWKMPKGTILSWKC